MKYLEKLLDFIRDLPDFVKHGAIGFVLGFAFGLIL